MNLKDSLVPLALTLLLAFVAVPSADAATGPDWQAFYQEELTAKAMYTQMADQFDSPLYDRLIQAEDRHARAIERILLRQGITPASDVPTFQVAGDEITALRNAFAFEKADVKGLQDALAKTTDPIEQRVLQNQIKASENHAKTLSRATGALEAGQPLAPLNGSCQGNGMSQGQGQAASQDQAFGQGQGPRQSQGQAVGQGQAFGQGQGARQSQTAGQYQGARQGQSTYQGEGTCLRS